MRLFYDRFYWNSYTPKIHPIQKLISSVQVQIGTKFVQSLEVFGSAIPCGQGLWSVAGGRGSGPTDRIPCGWWTIFLFGFCVFCWCTNVCVGDQETDCCTDQETDCCTDQETDCCTVSFGLIRLSFFAFVVFLCFKFTELSRKISLFRFGINHDHESWQELQGLQVFNLNSSKMKTWHVLKWRHDMSRCKHDKSRCKDARCREHLLARHTSQHLLARHN